MRRNFILLFLIALLLFLPGVLKSSASSSSLPKSFTFTPQGQLLSDPVSTQEGLVRGEVIGNTAIFRGIPYAAPPVGNLRWKEPQPAAIHSGIYDAINFGAPCAQPTRQATSNTDVKGSEDCLFLNIWAPKTMPSTPLPVMLFIHGGGNVTGSSNDTENGALAFDGMPFVEKANVILVTINYRLGPFGFLAHPELIAEDKAHGSSGNYGLLDQIFALQWVQQNIRNFGGDANNVTIFGESAGGSDVMSLVLTPLAKGLFHKAIPESGFPILVSRRANDSANSPNGKSALDLGLTLSKAIGCQSTDDVAGCLRSKTPLELLRAVPADQTGDITHSQNIPYGPNVDGYVFPMSGAEMLKNNMQNQVPVMIGSNKDEILGFIRGLGLKVETKDQLALYIGIFLGPQNVDAFMKKYPVADYGTPELTLNAIGTDFVFYCPIRFTYKALAANNPNTYVYLFTHTPVNDKNRGALHGDELSYVFDNVAATSAVPVTQDEIALGDMMFTYWTNFAKTGDPNGPGLPKWAPYKAKTDKIHVLDIKMSNSIGYRKQFCKFLDKTLDTCVCFGQ